MRRNGRGYDLGTRGESSATAKTERFMIAGRGDDLGLREQSVEF